MKFGDWLMIVSSTVSRRPTAIASISRTDMPPYVRKAFVERHEFLHAVKQIDPVRRDSRRRGSS